jgi:hypothetical protein
MNTIKYDEKLKPIIEHVKNGNYKAVKQWIDDGNPVFNPESKSKSVLYYAATNGFFSILELLVQADWKQEPAQLNSALNKSIDIVHLDCVRLLLENGADVKSVSWDSIFYTHNSRIVSLFFEYKKGVEDFENAIGQIEQGTAGAIKNALPAHPEFEIPVLNKMLEYLFEMEYYSSSELRYGMESAEEQAKQHTHYARLFGLLRWTGADVRRQLTGEDGSTSVLKYAVQCSKLSVIKTLKLTADDPINEYAQGMSDCDEAKLKYLIKLGLSINDQADGTSSHLLSYMKRGNLSVVQVFIDNGAKLPPVESKELKDLRYSLFHHTMPGGIFLSLAKVISVDQMKYLLTNSKVKEILGDTPEVIIHNLYDPANSESPDTFDRLMEGVSEELTLTDVHPVARKYRGYCTKSDRTPDPFPINIPGRNHDLYSFSSLQCSKEIRPWIIMLLNKIVPELEKQGGKFEFEESKSWGNHIDVNFCVNIRNYKIPLEFHEAVTSPKKYLSRENNAKSTFIGKLQFCHRLHGQKVKLAEEKTFMGFNDRIDYLVSRVVSVAELEDKHVQERREMNERWERERQERAQKEQQEYQARVKLENQRARSRQKVQEMIHEEQSFFKDFSKKAQAFEDCRIMRQYLAELKKEWLSSVNKLNDEQKNWLSRAELLLKHHDPFQKKTPRTIQDIEFPESLWDCQWAEIEAYIAKELRK